jgi:exopolyphosphatase / guanosine-5'-triphosphate,3'-diphosphate pyrophosphatase
LTTNKIVKILHTKQYAVIFQQDLSQNGNRTLSSERMLQGLNAIKDAIASANSLGADAITIIGTSVFRNAVNGEQFADTIHSVTGQQVHVLNQELEGKLAFQAALSTMNIDAEDLVVWDIGGGSTQWIGATAEGSHLVDGSNEGSGPFRDFIIESIQQRSIEEHKSPNPLSHEQAGLAEAHAHDLSVKVDQIFREKLRKPTTEIVGVGSVFGRGIAPLMAGKNPFTIEDLTAVVHGLVGKTDADLGGGDFACIEVSNALLVLGFMKGLAIEQMKITHVNNTDGALVYQPFWKESTIPFLKPL